MPKHEKPRCPLCGGETELVRDSAGAFKWLCDACWEWLDIEGAENRVEPRPRVRATPVEPPGIVPQPDSTSGMLTGQPPQ